MGEGHFIKQRYGQEPDSEERGKAVEAYVALVREKLKPWAMHMAARFDSPVYLTGSILHNENPRDIDVRVACADFAARYHQSPAEFDHDGPTQRWVDELAKICSALTRILGRTVDVQVWPSEKWSDDIYPKPILLAAPSPRWWISNEHVPHDRWVECDSKSPSKEQDHE